MELNGNLPAFSELSSIGLSHGALARIENARGTRLRVETGSVWVTHERCGDDVLLHAGETFRIERSGTTLVSSLGRHFALVTLEPATPLTATFAERFWDFWASLYVMPAHGPRTWL